MSIQNFIILSQIQPPAQSNQVLVRPRVMERLMTSAVCPVTIIEAGTGYGKSTSIISFVNTVALPIFWYTITGSDRDPTLFLAKLFTAFNQQGVKVGEEALHILDMPESTHQEAIIAFLNGVSTQLETDSIFVLDDFHRVSDVDEIMANMDWIIENLPSRLHLIIATRHKLEFSSISKWRVKGRICEIGKDELTFTDEETRQLFELQYGIQLLPEEIARLHQKTEGWAIGLQLVWQTLQSNPEKQIWQVLEDDSESRIALFDYLADEVMERLAPELQAFLLRTSLLSKLDNAICDFLMNSDNSDQVLNHLHKTGLFLEELRPGVFRYHQLFRDFLLNRLADQSEDMAIYHQKIASYYRAHEYWEEAIFHLLAAEEYHQINQILEAIGEKFIHEGRHETIHYWIDSFPDDLAQAFPFIAYLSGEVNRYLGNFEEALEHYHVTERLYRKDTDLLGISRALRGQARVFLDTIRPNNADQLLQDALQLLDPAETPDEVADLLVLTAENQLNLGFPESAEALLSQARELRPDLDMETDFIQARILLRTGRLQAGVELLQSRDFTLPVTPIARPQRFHRESSLLLSLFHAFLGEIEYSEQYAQKGIEIGKALQSVFVQSVGFMRLGHAIQLRSQSPFFSDGFNEAIQYYQESIEKIDVTRIHVEPLWGICRAMGFSQRVMEAEAQAFEGLGIAQKAGDKWISILIQLSLGSGQVLNQAYEKAHQNLTNAEVNSLLVKDPFTLSAARMWLAIRAWQQGFQNTAFGYLEKLLATVRDHHYEPLLTRETLLGLKDAEMIYPILIAAKENGVEKEMIKGLLKTRGLDFTTYHPGYTLWVRTFGSFRVWRGDVLISPDEWKRQKARQIFKLLVANRERWLHRDQIINMLWVDTMADTAVNYLKVVFNALHQVLEPDRPKGKTPFFIERRQDRYRLNPKARIMIDSDIFINEINKGTDQALETAIKLYEGHFFAGSYVQEWLTVEDQYYHQQFLLAATKLAQRYFNETQYEKALDVTYKVLSEDRLAEAAYRMQMRIFHKLGRYSMVRSVFKSCQETFQNQIDSQVSPKMVELYEGILSEEENQLEN
jgi:LuxR family transcriptional regulator, maltose regulon positive regulatory protein